VKLTPKDMVPSPGYTGETKISNIHWRKGHDVVQYLAALDMVLALTAYLPTLSPDAETQKSLRPRKLGQELTYNLIRILKDQGHEGPEGALLTIQGAMEAQAKAILSEFDKPVWPPRPTPANFGLMQLQAAVNIAESLAVNAFDTLNIAEQNTTPQTQKLLETSAKALDVFNSWVFAWVWLFSVNPQKLELTHAAQLKPMTDEELRNIAIKVK